MLVQLLSICSYKTRFSVIYVQLMYIKHTFIVDLAFCRREGGMEMARWPDGPR